MTIKPRTVLVGLAIMAIIISAGYGCAGLDVRLDPPTVQVAGVQLKEFKTLEASFTVELRVMNPNSRSIYVKGVNCDLEVNGKRLATGSGSVETEVPAYGSTTIPVTLYSSALNIAGGIMGLQHQDKLQYKLSGRLIMAGKFFDPSKTSFESGGELKLK